jgi:hypothetical protein
MSKLATWSGLGTLLFVGACTGMIGGGDDNNGTSSSPLCKGDPKPGPAPVRRLTRAQYNNTVRDLLGDTTQPANDFPPDESVGDFSNGAVHQTVSALLAQGYQSAAEALATKAVANLPAILPCNVQQAGEDPCAKSFIASFAKRAYRRPPTPAESDALFAVYSTNKTGADFTNGVQAVIEALLQSGPFLYFQENGTNDGRIGNAIPLTSWEMASRLSYLVWNSMPDDALFTLAESDQLKTPDQIEATVRKMFLDPKAHDATAEFFTEWLKASDLDSLSKDPTIYPGYNADVGASMKRGLIAFTSSVVWDGDGRLETLLTTPTMFVDGKTGPLYGSNATGSTLVKVELDGSRYAGLITQPAVLTVFAKPNQSSPVQRGKFVRERLFCQPLPPPPANIVIKPPEIVPGQTTRERFSQHDKDPACSSCHHLMDPIGFGFESFDGIGRWRDTDQGLPVDASGNLQETDTNGAFVGAHDLAVHLASSAAVRECVGTEWFRYAMARGVDADDDCSLATINDAMTKSNGNIRELIVGITRTPAFRYRRAAP